MEIIVVLVLALVVFGPKRLPELGQSMGKGIREFRGTLSGESKTEEDKKAAALEPAPVKTGTVKADTATEPRV